MKPTHPIRCLVILACTLAFAHVGDAVSAAPPSEEQLARWLKRFPKADANGDGKLTVQEAEAYRRKVLQARRPGVRTNFNVDPGWDEDRFPDHAVCYLRPSEIADVYSKTIRGGNPVASYDKPADGSLRIVGTGHSFMGPGYGTFPKIAKAAGFNQPPLVTHTGGGMTGSTRYKWEQENGIFQFDGKPRPKLLASIANAEWDAMMWGPYFHDRPQYYSCWIDFGLKYNPDMKFYLSDAWPQLDQLDELPTKPEELTPEMFRKLGAGKNEIYGELVGTLNKDYPDKVFIMPTSDAMVLAVEYFHKGQLPGVEGIHRLIGGKERSLWRDRLGHLGPGFGQLEGHVFYATLYGRSPELIKSDIDFGPKGYPSAELDRAFRRIAWQAVINNPMSGVTDENQNGVSDRME